MTKYMMPFIITIVIGILAGCSSSTMPQNTTISDTEPTAPTEMSAVVAVDEDAIRREIDSMTEEEYLSGFTASIEAWTKESPVKIDKFENVIVEGESESDNVMPSQNKEVLSDIPWYEISPYDNLPKGTSAEELFGTHHFSTENDFEYIPPSTEEMKGYMPKALISSHYHVSLPNNMHSEFVDIIAQIDDDTYVNVTDLIDWNVEDDAIAYVYDGRIMANEKGSTVVTASFAGFEVSIDVVVEATEDFERVLLNDSENEVLGTWSVDLTHDDNEELVMISQVDSEYIFEIYMMIDGTPTVIYQDRASDNHAGWRWYYLMEVDGKNYLLQYVPEIWNGIGEYRYVVFSFDQNGQKVVFESHELSYDSLHISEEEKTELSEKLEAFLADYETWQSRGIPLLTVGSDPLTGIVYHSVMEKESTSKY